MDGAATIVAIIDGAEPLRFDLDTASESSTNNVAPRQRRGRSSSFPDQAAAPATSPPLGAAEPPAHPGRDARPAAVLLSDESQPSRSGGGPENEPPAEGAAPAPGSDDALREERRREEEIRREALNRELAKLPMTDLGNAERFRHRFGHLFKWCPSLGWFAWDERRWARKGADERVHIAVHETVRAIQDEAKACFDDADTLAGEIGDEAMAQAEAAKKKKPAVPKKGSRRRKADGDPPPLDPRVLVKVERVKRMRLLGMQLAEWGLDSEMNSKLTPVEKHAAPYLSVDIEEFDADPWKINCANGTLVVDRDAPGYVRFKPHDPADLITKLSPAEYAPHATCPRFDRFLGRVQPVGGERRFLRAWFGYSLTGDASAQQLVVLHGEGRNGKGVLVRICAHVAGDYAKATPIETFLAEGSPRNASQPTPERAALPGVRLLHTSEPKKGALLDEAFIKLITGGDRVSARDLNKSQFEFTPVFKLTISGNHRPKINDQTESIWARVNLVPWSVIIPKEERDLDLDAKLREEASGVLNWLLDGLRDYLDNGLVRSEAIEKATAEYRQDSDQLGRFLEDCTVRDPDGKEQSSLLYDLFIAWAKANGANEWKHAGFTNAMKERGFATYKSNVMFFVGLRTTKSRHDFVDADGKPVVHQHDGSPSAGADRRRPDADDDIVPF